MLARVMSIHLYEQGKKKRTLVITVYNSYLRVVGHHPNRNRPGEASDGEGVGQDSGWNFVSASTPPVCQTGSVYRKFSARMMSLYDASNCV